MESVNVVLAIDGSEHSERALKFYLDYLHRDGQVVNIVHAVEVSHNAEKRQANQQHAKEVEEKFTKQLEAKQIKFVLFSEASNPGEYICRVANDQKALMICMGTRGMGTLRRTIMGSVSDYVLHHAHCPVAIARH